MPLWKKILLNFYYHGTLPLRRRRLARMKAEGNVPVAVLFYHHVAPRSQSPWTVSTRMFQRQIEWFGQHFKFVSMEEAVRRIREGISTEPCLHITFDDGYGDNCDDAVPLLLDSNIPFTYFVTTDHVLSGEPFPHDVERGMPLRPNTLEEIRAMSEAGVEIGGHTATHSDLGTIHDSSRLHYEIVEAGQKLEKLIGRGLRYFAFPFGLHDNMSDEAFQIAKDAGYEAICSAYGGYNLPGDDPFHIQRFSATEDFIALKNWLTFDPRKFNTPRFDYRLEATSLERQSDISLETDGTRHYVS